MRRALAALLLVFAWLIPFSPAAATEQRAMLPSVTLEQALAYARAHQPSLRAAMERVAVARGQASVPRAAYLPRIGATAQVLEGTSNNTSASYLATSATDIVRIGGTPANSGASWVPQPSTFAGMGVRQELFDFGRLTTQAEGYDFLAKAAEDDARLERLDIALLVQEAYFNVRASKQILRASVAALSRAKGHRDLAAAAVRAGLRPPIELTRADADLSRFEVGRIRASGALDVSRTAFAAAVGSPEAALDTAEEQVPDLAVPPVSEILSRLHANDPAFRAAASRLSAQQSQTAAIGAELRPDLSLSAGLNARAGGSEVSGRSLTGGGWIPNVPNWDALVILSWPFFDPVVSARASVSRATEAVRQAELDAIDQRDRTAVQRAYVEHGVARSAVPALQAAFDAARANEAQADARFKAGLGTALELADAETLVTDAEIQLAIGLFEQSTTRARLGRAIAEAVQ